jgi:heme A synthase
MTGFQRLCIITCAVIFGLIVLGGVVRATDSGLGCPDWPLCHGNIIPTADKHTIIEWSHRTTASVVGFLMLGIIVMAFRHYRRVPAILYPSVAAGVLLIAQAGLGGAAVLNELPPEIIMVHLGMALTILTLLIVITLTSFSMTRAFRPLSVDPGLARVALAASAATLVLMLVGSYVAGAHYGLACSGWPLCNGDVVPGGDSASVQVHFLHRVLAALLGVILVGLLWLAWRSREATPLAFTLAGAAFGVFLLQALIGAANVWTELAAEVAAAHLATATLLWLLLALLNVRVWRLHERLPRTAGQPAPSGLAGVTR